jgi:hypothetical protein
MATATAKPKTPTKGKVKTPAPETKTGTRKTPAKGKTATAPAPKAEPKATGKDKAAPAPKAPVRAATKKAPVKQRAAAAGKEATSKAPAKAPAKAAKKTAAKTSTAAPRPKVKVASRNPADRGVFGFAKGSNQDLAAHALVAGGTSRTDIINDLRAKDTSKTASGTDRNWSAIVGTTQNILMARGYTVEATFRLIPPVTQDGDGDTPALPVTKVAADATAKPRAARKAAAPKPKPAKPADKSNVVPIDKGRKVQEGKRSAPRTVRKPTTHVKG